MSDINRIGIDHPDICHLALLCSPFLGSSKCLISLLVLLEQVKPNLGAGWDVVWGVLLLRDPEEVEVILHADNTGVWEGVLQGWASKTSSQCVILHGKRRPNALQHLMLSYIKTILILKDLGAVARC